MINAIGLVALMLSLLAVFVPSGQFEVAIACRDFGQCGWILRRIDLHDADSSGDGRELVAADPPR